MKHTRRLSAIALASMFVHVACGPSTAVVPVPTGDDLNAGASNDTCDPSKLVAAGDAPEASCALETAWVEPDLGLAVADDTATTTALGDDGVGLLDEEMPVVRRSCEGRVGPGITTCGATRDQSCCATAAVPHGAVRSYHLEGFDLGVYEVTSGRFLAFVEATGGNLRGAAEAGQWPGWEPEWTQHLPADRAKVDAMLGDECTTRSALYDYGARTWPSQQIVDAVNDQVRDDNEVAEAIRTDATAPQLLQKPVNCVTYEMAAAFCAWDGGRLPTQAEWTLAARGGDERRAFPWGEKPRYDRAVFKYHDEEAAQYWPGGLAPCGKASFHTYPDALPCTGLGHNAFHIAPPGQRPLGRALWGHEDMGGNLLEWMADREGGMGIVRGGSWEGHPLENRLASSNYPTYRSYGSLGMRCAYGPAPVRGGEPSRTAALVPVLRASRDGRFELGRAADVRGDTVAFRVLGALEPAGTRMLHRCVRGERSYVSNDGACEGGQHVGELGAVYSEQVQDTLPLLRCSSARSSLSTVTPEECAELGLTVEGVQGFVVPPPPERYVRQLYTRGMSRELGRMGFTRWMTFFRKNGCSAETLATFARRMFNSPEFEALPLNEEQRVRRLFHTVLEEWNDDGMMEPVRRLKAGEKWSTIVEEVVQRREATARAPERCETTEPKPADSCAGRADGWYCSAVDTASAYQCAGGATAGGKFCAGTGVCLVEAGQAQCE